MNDNEFYNYEDRAYIQPTLSSGEQEKFIDNFRDVQKQNNAQIAEQTYNLGTQVPSNLGGLGGGEAYFTSRYQTPQVGEMVATLKSAAQAQTLNDAMTNYQNQLNNRYKQAYREYQKRERARQRALYNAQLAAYTNGGGGGNDGVDYNTSEGDVLTIGDNGVTLPSSGSDNLSKTSNTLNTVNTNTGSGKLPSSNWSGGYYTLNGKNVGFRTHDSNQGGAFGGLETPLGSYTKEGARNLLNSIVKQGGKVYNSAGKDVSNNLNLYFYQNGLY